MKVVIDTNVIVSSILKDKDPERVIMFAVTQPAIEWMVTQEILDEYREVISRPKFKLPELVKEGWLELFLESTTLIPSKTAIDFPRDKADAKFLACAQASDADYFITGDRDFTDAQKLVTTTIISVSLFKKEVCDKVGK